MALAVAGCVGQVAPVQCATDGDCAGGFCLAGTCHPGTRECPALEPRFSSINQNLIQVGCGVTNSGTVLSSNCHGAQLSPGGSNLDLTASRAYANLVSIRACDAAAPLDAGIGDLASCADAGTGTVQRRDDCGVHAGAGELARVQPGDPGRSFLFVKLQMSATAGICGSGMPPDHPGMYACADVLDAVEQWIAKGAPND